jgi:hypothetical protein
MRWYVIASLAILASQCMKIHGRLADSMMR